MKKYIFLDFCEQNIYIKNNAKNENDCHITMSSKILYSVIFKDHGTINTDVNT